MKPPKGRPRKRLFAQMLAVTAMLVIASVVFYVR